MLFLLESANLYLRELKTYPFIFYMNRKSIEFHIKSQDYFGNLATILSLMEQTANNNIKNGKILGKIIKDLLYLQENYKINKK